MLADEKEPHLCLKESSSLNTRNWLVISAAVQLACFQLIPG